MKPDDPVFPTDLLTPNEAAQLLGTSPAAIRRWVHVGNLHAFKLGGRLRISRADVLAMLKRVEPAHGPILETKAEKEAQDAETDRVLRAAGIRK